MTSTANAITALTADVLLNHWQGHRRLTRRMIEAFPEDKLFSFSLGGMRPFSELAMEFLKMTVPIARGVATGKWDSADFPTPKTKAEILVLWDRDTQALNAVWPTIPAHRFAEVDKAFGQWENSGIGTILYGIDNENHHRGQGYVYLRALGIEPPAFYDGAKDGAYSPYYVRPFDCEPAFCSLSIARCGAGDFACVRPKWLQQP